MDKNTQTELTQRMEDLRKNTQAELTQRMEDLREFCTENKIPLFAACWVPPRKKRDDGYIYEMVSPIRLGIDIEKTTKEKDRFLFFLGGILGFDRTKYYQ